MSASLCVGECGFYGNPQLNGFCSVCYRLFFGEMDPVSQPEQISPQPKSPLQIKSFEEDSKLPEKSEKNSPEACVSVDCDFFGNPEQKGYCSTCFDTKQKSEREEEKKELSLKLVSACRAGTLLDIVKLLANGAGINTEEYTDCREDGPWFALQVACAEGRIDLVKLLLHAKGIDVNKRGYLDSYAIHSAIQNHHFRTTQLLVEECRNLKLGLNLDKRGYGGWTPIDMCCNAVACLLDDEERGVKDEEGKIDKFCMLIRFLVKHGAQKKCLEEFNGVLLRAFICDEPPKSRDELKE